MNPEQTSDYYRQHPAARYVALAVVCIGSLVPPLTLGTIIVALPALAQDLAADAVLVSLVPMVLLLTSVMALLPAGKLADSFGRKRIYLCGLIVITLSAVMASAAPSIEWILVFRAIQGLGSAMLFGTGMAIITAIFPPNERGLPLGILAGSVYVGLTIAPYIGGWATELWGWRSVFLVQVPFALLVMGLIVFGLKGEWKAQARLPFDYTGAVLFALAALCFVLAMQGLPGLVYVGLLIMSVLLLWWFMRHIDSSAAPLFRLGIFKQSRVFSLSLLTSALMYGSTYPIGFLISLYLQYIQGVGPAAAGEIMLVQAMAMAILAPLSGRLSDMLEPRYVATAGCLTFAIGLFVLISLDFDSPLSQVTTALLFLGVGFGLFSSANNNAAMSSVPAGELGSGAALVNLARVLGNLAGMGLVLLIVQQTLGPQEITPERYQALLTTIQTCLCLSLGYVLTASMVSLARGKLRH